VPIRFESVERVEARPNGARFGQLVHDALERVDFDGDEPAIDAEVRSAARGLAAPEEEVDAAVRVIERALAHPVLVEARGAERVRREWPVAVRTDTGELLDGVIDLLFFAAGRWTVVDYKTGRLGELARDAAKNQVAWYVHAVGRAFDAPVRGFVLEI